MGIVQDTLYFKIGLNLTVGQFLFTVFLKRLLKCFFSFVIKLRIGEQFPLRAVVNVSKLFCLGNQWDRAEPNFGKVTCWEYNSLGPASDTSLETQVSTEIPPVSSCNQPTTANLQLAFQTPCMFLHCYTKKYQRQNTSKFENFVRFALNKLKSQQYTK